MDLSDGVPARNGGAHSSRRRCATAPIEGHTSVGRSSASTAGQRPPSKVDGTAPVPRPSPEAQESKAASTSSGTSSSDEPTLSSVIFCSVVISNARPLKSPLRSTTKVAETTLPPMTSIR